MYSLLSLDRISLLPYAHMICLPLSHQDSMAKEDQTVYPYRNSRRTAVRSFKFVSDTSICMMVALRAV